MTSFEARIEVVDDGELDTAAVVSQRFVDYLLGLGIGEAVGQQPAPDFASTSLGFKRAYLNQVNVIPSVV